MIKLKNLTYAETKLTYVQRSTHTHFSLQCYSPMWALVSSKTFLHLSLPSAYLLHPAPRFFLHHSMHHPRILMWVCFFVLWVCGTLVFVGLSSICNNGLSEVTRLDIIFYYIWFLEQQVQFTVKQHSSQLVFLCCTINSTYITCSKD